VVNFTPRPFYPSERTLVPTEHEIQGSVGHGAGPEVLENEKIFVSTTNHPPVPSHYTDYAIPRYLVYCLYFR